MVAVAAAVLTVPAPARAADARVLRPAVWFAFVLELGLALLFIGVPSQFELPTYAGLRPWVGLFALAFAVASAALLALALAEDAVPAALGAVVVAAAGLPLVALGLAFALSGVPAGAATWGTIGSVVVAAAAASGLGAQVRWRPTVVIAALVEIAGGVVMTLVPESYAAGALAPLAPLLWVLAPSFVIAGVGLLVGESTGSPALRRAAAALAIANLTPIFTVAVDSRLWTGVLVYGTLGSRLLLASWRADRRGAVALLCGVALLLALQDVAALVAGVERVDRPAAHAVAGAAMALAAAVMLARAAGAPRAVRPLGGTLSALAASAAVASALLVPAAPEQPFPAIGVAVCAAIAAAVVTVGGFIRPGPRISAFAGLAGAALSAIGALSLIAYVIDAPYLLTALAPMGLRLDPSAAATALGIAIVVRSAPGLLRGGITPVIAALIAVVVLFLVVLGLFTSAAGGRLLLLLDTAPSGARELVRDAVAVAQGLLVLLAFAIFALGVIASRAITRPIDRLLGAITAFDEGDRDARVNEASADGVTHVAVAFNSMADRLTDAERELQRLNADLELRIEQRTAELAAATRELEAFAYSVSHDLRAPLRAIDGFSLALLEDHGETLPQDGRRQLQRVRAATQNMSQLIDDMLRLSLVTRSEMKREHVDVTALAEEIVRELRAIEPGRAVDARVAPGLVAHGDPALVRTILDNLIGNAWKFTRREATAWIEVAADGDAIRVADNGAGFDAAYAERLFRPFERLHAKGEFEGTGIGLATVERVVRRHGGRVWADGAPGRGATFWFTLGEPR